jgi:hypothetical protein
MGHAALAEPMVRERRLDAPKTIDAIDIVQQLARRAAMPVARYSPKAVPKGRAIAENRWRKMLLINGRTCLIRHATAFSSRRGNDRIVLGLTERELRLAEFLVLYVDVPGYAPRTYVVPTRVLLEALKLKMKKSKRFTIPLATPKRPTSALMAWSAYQGAWHLFLCN